MEELEMLWKEKSKKAKNMLESYIESVDSEALLAIMIGYLCFTSPEFQVGDQLGRHPRMIEVLANILIPNFGRTSKKAITPELVFECYNLLDEYTQSTAMFPSEDNGNHHKVGTVQCSLRMASEIIRGDAYPEQTKERILAIQGRFDRWFLINIGISPTRAVNTINLIIDDLEKKYSSYLEQFFSSGNEIKNDPDKVKTFENEDSAFIYGYIKELISISPKIIPVDLNNYDLNTEEINALKKLIGVSKDNWVSGINIQLHPMYILSTGKVLFSDLSNLLDVLWQSFDLSIKNDNKVYQRYQKHRANWLEEKAVSILERIFVSSPNQRELPIFHSASIRQ